MCPSRASLSTGLNLRPKWRIRARRAIRTNCSLTNLKSGPITRHLGREFQQRPTPAATQTTDGSASCIPDPGERVRGPVPCGEASTTGSGSFSKDRQTAARETDSAHQIGTRLLRMWRGEMHEVIATGNGYLYRGQTYSSLSKIAREITGTRWSGPLFFGVRKP